MNTRKLFALLALMALILPLMSACAKPTPEVTVEVVVEKTEEPTEEPTEDVTEEPTEEVTEEPTEEPAPEPDYDTAIYGYIEEVDPSGQEVTYWYQHTGSREELMLAMIDDFNRNNEWGITVVGESQGGYNDLYQKIIAGIPARSKQ